MQKVEKKYKTKRINKLSHVLNYRRFLKKIIQKSEIKKRNENYFHNSDSLLYLEKID